MRKEQYPPIQFGSQRHRLQASCFNTFPWLEYSISQDAAFCFSCFLFQKYASSQVAFTIDGFRCWKRVNDNNKCSFLVHVGTPNLTQGKTIKSLEGLQNVTRHIDKVVNFQPSEDVKKNRLRFRTTIESVL